MVTMFGYALLTTYWAVLVAELVGDKSIYTVASLSLRFPKRLVFLGMAAAFGGKMLAAVAFGQFLVQVPARFGASLSALIFFVAALLMWMKKPALVPAAAGARVTSLPSTSRMILVPFAALFFTEWGDLGQISAAALAVQFHFALPVWLGGTLALLTKGTLAMTLGLRLRDRLSQNTLRVFGTGSCCILGFLSLGECLFR